MPASRHRNRLLVFSDDWGRHPSSCQHLVRRLLDSTDVTWVNTIGTRRPSFDLYSLRRGLEKVGGWVRPNRSSSSSETVFSENGISEASVGNPRVVSPWMWPSFGSRFGRQLNRRLLDRMLAREACGGDWIAVTTLPIVADLVSRARERGLTKRWVYYCVDNLAEWPQLDRAALERMEERLLAEVDEVVVVSHELEQRMAAKGVSATLLTHGVDLEAWANRRTPSVAEPLDRESPVSRDVAGSRETGGSSANGVDSWSGSDRQESEEVRDLLPPDRFPRPLVTFWGVVDERLATPWLAQLERRLERGTILLMGPHNNPSRELLSLGKVRAPGAMSFEQLPLLARASSVLVMPYADLPVTRAMQPLKLKEYLATGLPVVCADLPAVEPWRKACDVVADGDSFARTVLERIGSAAPESQQLARRRLAEESWESKADRFTEILFSKEIAGVA